MSDYEFTQPWFEKNRPIWSQIFKILSPQRMLEIGAFEGAASCFSIENLRNAEGSELICIDAWEQQLSATQRIVAEISMTEVEKRFDLNTAKAVKLNPFVQLHKIKERSKTALPKLLADNHRAYFDLIYIDGSHEAADVMFDAVMSFELLRVGGIIIFDDYLLATRSSNGVDPLRNPKLAIDSFTTLYWRKLKIIESPNFQVFVEKTGGA